MSGRENPCNEERAIAADWYADKIREISNRIPKKAKKAKTKVNLLKV